MDKSDRRAAIVVPGGFYPTGLPFGLEFSGRPWKDGDLLGWAFAYEQATKHRKPPVLIEKHAGDSPSSSQRPQPTPVVPLVSPVYLVAPRAVRPGNAVHADCACSPPAWLPCCRWRAR
jgi:hypothetical protein